VLVHHLQESCRIVFAFGKGTPVDLKHGFIELILERHDKLLRLRIFEQGVDLVFVNFDGPALHADAFVDHELHDCFAVD